MSSLLDGSRAEFVHDRSYRAHLFHCATDVDRAQLESLIGEEAGIAIFDSLQAQLRDLMKARHPGRRLASIELQELVEGELAGRVASDYGVWAYYPWSRRLVHLLDEPEFVELRTNRNCYKISPQERVALAAKKIGVVGLSVGQSVALVLALERSFGELRLADFDTLDLSNLNRLRAGVHNLGVPKVYITAREIAEIDPFLNVVCFPEGVTAGNLESFILDSGRLDLIVEECDSIDLKIDIRFAARRYRIPVLMDTSDRGVIDIERFDLEPERPIFHGAVGDLDPAQLRGLSTADKLPYALRIIGVDTISTRLRASLLEVDQSIATWPQLASAVAMGGGVTADVARRLLLGQQRLSGRFFVDVEKVVPNTLEPPTRRGVEVHRSVREPEVAPRASWCSAGAARRRRDSCPIGRQLTTVEMALAAEPIVALARRLALAVAARFPIAGIHRGTWRGRGKPRAGFTCRGPARAPGRVSHGRGFAARSDVRILRVRRS